MSLQHEVAILRRVNATLSERVAFLESKLTGDGDDCPHEWNLTGQEAAFVGLLLRSQGKCVRLPALTYALWGVQSPDDRRNHLKVLACKTRGKLAAFGYRVRSAKRVGYVLERTS